ncbi:MAG: ribosome biogenesis factor YjgA [Panacagrimonas sp.]
MQRPNYPDDEPEFEGPSKTQLKQASQDLKNDLGGALLALSAAQLATVEMDERLRDALHLFARMPTREAKRRHMQLIGKLLRNTDTEPAQRAVLAFRAGDARLLAEAERWREKLLADDAAMTDWIKAHPAADAQPLRALVRNARRELATELAVDAGTVPARSKSRAFRELFQYVRAGLRSSDGPASE